MFHIKCNVSYLYLISTRSNSSRIAHRIRQSSPVMNSFIFDNLLSADSDQKRIQLKISKVQLKFSGVQKKFHKTLKSKFFMLCKFLNLNGVTFYSPRLQSYPGYTVFYLSTLKRLNRHRCNPLQSWDLLEANTQGSSFASLDSPLWGTLRMAVSLCSAIATLRCRILISFGEFLRRFLSCTQFSSVLFIH